MSTPSFFDSSFTLASTTPTASSEEDKKNLEAYFNAELLKSDQECVDAADLRLGAGQCGVLIRGAGHFNKSHPAYTDTNIFELYESKGIGMILIDPASNLDEVIQPKM